MSHHIHKRYALAKTSLEKQIRFKKFRQIESVRNGPKSHQNKIQIDRIKFATCEAFLRTSTKSPRSKNKNVQMLITLSIQTIEECFKYEKYLFFLLKFKSFIRF